MLAPRYNKGFLLLSAGCDAQRIPSSPRLGALGLNHGGTTRRLRRYCATQTSVRRRKSSGSTNNSGNTQPSKASSWSRFSLHDFEFCLCEHRKFRGRPRHRRCQPMSKEARNEVRAMIRWCWPRSRRWPLVWDCQPRPQKICIWRDFLRNRLGHTSWFAMLMSLFVAGFSIFIYFIFPKIQSPSENGFTKP